MADGGATPTVEPRGEGLDIERVRRRYNRWVADETLEDYAPRFTANRARRWSTARVANTAIGSISFLALEAIGGAITLSYGFDNAVAAILVVSTLIFITGLPIAYYAAKCGVDIDLLTRGAGFGYIGSTISSLIYASFTFIFFALEGVIMALALEMSFGVPLEIGFLLNGIIVIPLVTHGIANISWFQLYTQPAWIVLHILPFVFIGVAGAYDVEAWTEYRGRLQGEDGGINLLMFGAASAVVFSLIAQIGEQVDFLRFLPRDRRKGKRARWWIALVAAGPGWVVLGALKMLAGSYLVVFALGEGVAPENAAEPTQMYLTAFQQVIQTPEVALAVTGIFIVISQLKINVTNAYAGSIAWSNFFSRLTHSHPGRVVWLVFNVLIAMMLMMFGVFQTLEHVLGLYATVAVAWVGAIFADLVIIKPLGLSPRTIEFRRAHLYDINPVGVGALIIASALSIIAYSGLAGETARMLSSFIALGAAVVTAPAIAYLTKGKYYIAREVPGGPEGVAQECCICTHSFEPEDMTHCPVYAGPICSLCCALDARCDDACKTGARFSDQADAFFKTVLPAGWVRLMGSRVGHFLALYVLIAAVVAGALGLIYAESALDPTADMTAVAATLWRAFALLMIISGVTAWLYVLSNESRKVAQEESRRQTQRLQREIEAHERTDAELQRAKEAAEAANLAKSRYLVGISHELRTPLNAILGYAQLLEADESLPARRRGAVSVIRRSGEHLSGLIEGLLDISKIEAGRHEICRDEVSIREFFDQIADMFRIQAEAKGITFTYGYSPHLPDYVHTDEKRLRQILINLLSNAIKFTTEGEVSFHVAWRSEVAEFLVEDTGCGIRSDDLERIFRPFERIAPASGSAVPGTGLGLTITKLLTEVMGGEITVKSTVGGGSRFRIRLMLAAVTSPPRVVRPKRRVIGYQGPRRRLLVADDNSDHRNMINDMLAPLGIVLFFAEDGEMCLRMAPACDPDLFFLDLTMPGIDGWEVARRLRSDGFPSTPIVIVSANANEVSRRHEVLDHDDFIVKPVKYDQLLDRLERHLGLRWIDELQDPADGPASTVRPSGGARLSAEQIAELRELGSIGYVRGIEAALAGLQESEPQLIPVLADLRSLVSTFDLERYDSVLEAMQVERSD